MLVSYTPAAGVNVPTSRYGFTRAPGCTEACEYSYSAWISPASISAVVKIALGTSDRYCAVRPSKSVSTKLERVIEPQSWKLEGGHSSTLQLPSFNFHIVGR